MSTELKDKKILIIATDGFEQSELEVPLEQLKSMGAQVDVAAPKSGSIRGWNKKDWGDKVDVTMTLAEVKPDIYDALVLPGGQMNPDLLRLEPAAIDLIRYFARAGKTIAAVCHAPWLLIDAGLAKGRRMTSWPSVRIDLQNAGATVVDEEVVVDQGVITSRKPEDLDAFVKAIAAALTRT